MSITLAILSLVFLIAGLAFLFVNTPPRIVANFLLKFGPLLLIGLGTLLLMVGRAGIGLPLIMGGGMWWRYNRNNSPLPTQSPKQFSTVRSAWLEMDLDHDTGDLDGTVLIGQQEGRRLSRLTDEEALDLYAELISDNESAALMEAYLDRQIPGWREHTETSDSSGEDSPSGSGPMSKEEAYQVLGLSSSAGSEEIKAAHRRLMKAVHPDSGGSTFLAARINQAKDTLLD